MRGKNRKGAQSGGEVPVTWGLVSLYKVLGFLLGPHGEPLSF